MTPYYVEDSEGALNSAATIWLQDDVRSNLSIDSATFTNNTFNYTGSVEGWTNVGLYEGNQGDSTIVDPTILDADGNTIKETAGYYKEKKYSNMHGLVNFKYKNKKNEEETIKAYFENYSDAQAYTVEKLISEFGLRAISDEEYKDLAITSVEEINKLS